MLVESSKGFISTIPFNSNEYVTLGGTRSDSFQKRVRKNGFICSYYNSTMDHAIVHCSYLQNGLIHSNNIEKPFDKLDNYKKISVYLSKDDQIGHRQKVQCFGQNRRNIIEKKKIITSPNKLNYYLNVTKNCNYYQFINGKRGKQYSQELLNTANSVMELLLENPKAIVIIQSRDGDLATAVSALAHLLVVYEIHQELEPNFIDNLIKYEFKSNIFRMLYVDPKEQIIARNAVYLEFLGALQILGVKVDKYLKAFSFINTKNCIIEQFNNLLPSEQNYLLENIPKKIVCKHIKRQLDEYWLRISDAKAMKEKFPLSIDKVYNDESLQISDHFITTIHRDKIGSSLKSNDQKNSFVKIAVSFVKLQNTIKPKCVVGYLQGMNEIISVLVKRFSEEDAYYIFLGIMFSSKYGEYYRNYKEIIPSNRIIVKAYRLMLVSEIPDLSLDNFSQPSCIETLSIHFFISLAMNIYGHDDGDVGMEMIERFLLHGERFILSMMIFLTKYSMNYNIPYRMMRYSEFVTLSYQGKEFQNEIKTHFPFFGEFLARFDKEMIPEGKYQSFINRAKNS